MKILTWNVNGIRASNRTKSIKNLLDSLQADVVCFQETKITRNLLTSDIGNVDGYLAFFSFSRKKGGYSGVVTYCKKSCCPVASEEGLSGIHTGNDAGGTVGWYDTPGEFTKEYLTELDGEGRSVITEHKNTNGDRICIVNVYCPMAVYGAEENEGRYTFKMNFYRLLESRCRALHTAGKHVIVVGDFNVSHRRIDHCDPDAQTFDTNPSRKWFDRMLFRLPLTTDSIKLDDLTNNLSVCEKYQNDVIKDDCFTDVEEPALFVDMFRLFHRDKRECYTCWNTKTRARETNYGTRIDYILATHELAESEFKDCVIRADIQGSDHCPVVATLATEFVKHSVVPSTCAVFMPECCGKQRDINSYFGTKATMKRKFDVNEELMSNTSAGIKRRKTPEIKNILNYYEKQSSNKTKATASSGISRASEAPLNNETFITESFSKIAENTEKAQPKKVANTKNSWKNILKGPGPTPKCTGHGEISVLRTVKKEGPNFGRQFYVCNKPAGHSTNKQARCNFFQWKT